MPGATAATGMAGLTSANPMNPTQSAVAATPAGMATPPMPDAATSPLGGGDISSALSQLVGMLAMVLQSLMSVLLQLGGAAAGGSAAQQQSPALPQSPAAIPQASPAYDRERTPAAAELAGGVKNTTSNASQKQRLDTTLAKVAKDPEGSKLLAAAKAKGYTIEVGDPSKAGGSRDANDHDSINGVTNMNTKKIVINPNAPDFDKTVVHELVHAATDGDGNSQKEEGMADVVGYRVASRMDGTRAPGSEKQIYQDKIKSYPNLQASNNIMSSLNNLGITA